MANTIRDYSATAASNTVVDGADTSEGCSPAGINDAIRGVMADLKDVSTGAVALESPAADSLSVTGDLTVDTNTLYVDSTNNRVGVNNAAPATALDVTGGLNTTGRVGIGGAETTVFNGIGGDMNLVVLGNDSTTTIGNNSNSGIAIVNTNHTAGNIAGLHFARADTDYSPNYAGASIVAQFPEAQVAGQYPKGDLAFLTSTATNSAPSEKMRLTAAGKVGIGTSSPAYKLSILENANNFLQFSQAGDSVVGSLIGRSSSLNLRIQQSENAPIEFWTNNTERMQIDSSGIVTMPYQPSFYAYGAAAYQGQGGSGFAYGSTQFNTGGHYNTSTYRYTAPVAGLYYFSAAAIMQASAADGGVVLVKNGTFRFAKDYTNGSGRSSNVSSVIYLNANDYVFVDYEGNNTWYLTDGYGFFSGYLIG
jgi:hypothetical protein